MERNSSFDHVWEEIFSVNPWGQYPSENLIRFIAKNYYSSDRSTVSIAELGCGPGANLWYCAREGFQVYGIDGSESAVNRCIDRLNREVPGWIGKIERSCVTNVPFETASMNCVIDSECGCCLLLDDAKEMYREAARILAPHGKIFIRTFALGCYGEGTGVQIEKNTWRCTKGAMANKGHTRFTDINNIEELLPRDLFCIDQISEVRESRVGIKDFVRELIIEATVI